MPPTMARRSAPRHPASDHTAAAGGEVVEDVLLVGEVARLVPRFAELAAAADVRERVDAARASSHRRRTAVKLGTCGCWP